MRVPLHTGIATGRKVVSSVLVAVMMLTFPVLTFVLSVPALDLSWLGWAILVVGELGCVLFLFGIFRYAAWLENTTLVVRRTFRTRHCDLAAAPQIALVRNVTQRYPRPELQALDRRTGRWVSVLLYRPTSLDPLHPAALHAIAHAIEAGSGHRNEPNAQQAAQIARGIRGWADDPLAGFR